jgi:serine phosphatase RsbU (regulator of sigma subunit)
LGFGYASRTAEEIAQIGGDFIDVSVLADQKPLLVIGDVAGRGVASARAVDIVRGTIRAMASIDPDPASILDGANRILNSGQRRLEMVTACVIAVDLEAGLIRYATAGHPAPILCHPDGRCVLLEAEYGPPLATVRDSVYTTASASFPPSALLVAYSDGVTEARSVESMFGEERLIDLIGPGLAKEEGRLAEDIVRAASKYAGESPADDMVVLVVRHKWPESG